MTKIKNVVPYIAGIGAFMVGVKLIRKYHFTKSKECSNRMGLEKKNEEDSHNPKFVSFDDNRHYIELTEIERKDSYMDWAPRSYIELGEVSVKKKSS